jgi:hypothetical protein
VQACPSKTTLPERGRNAPLIRLNKVDLPAPFGPMIAVMRFRSAAKLTSSTALRPPKEMPMPFASRIGPLIGGPP